MTGSQLAYLKTIGHLQETTGKVRNTDIAKALGYKKPSVTVALRNLVVDGMVIIGEDGSIQLTEAGIAAVGKAKARYEILYHFFLSVGADPEIADENSCRIGHLVTEELIHAIERYNELNLRA